ncbi:MAG: hypothetical protein AABM33_13580, partial [Pseudomonadota bacterium]
RDVATVRIHKDGVSFDFRLEYPYRDVGRQRFESPVAIDHGRPRLSHLERRRVNLVHSYFHRGCGRSDDFSRRAAPPGLCDFMGWVLSSE